MWQSDRWQIKTWGRRKETKTARNRRLETETGGGGRAPCRQGIRRQIRAEWQECGNTRVSHMDTFGYCQPSCVVCFRQTRFSLPSLLCNTYFRCCQYGFSIDWLVVGSVKCKKIVKYVDESFPKSKLTPSDVLFPPHVKDIQLTVMEESWNQ